MLKRNIKKQINGVLHKGFTLAEILLALTIIGIIAASTIPPLIQTTQDLELKAAYKKEYSLFNQMVQKIMVDNGGTLKGICNNWDHSCMMDFYAKYLIIAKRAYYSGAAGAYWHPTDGSSHYLDGTPVTSAWPNDGAVGRESALLNDGSMILVDHHEKDCSDTSMSDFPICGVIYIDVNGFKPPNVVGKDIFRIYILQTGVKPFGAPGDEWILYGPDQWGFSKAADNLINK